MEELDLRDLLHLLRKRLKMIVLVTLVATVTSGIISLFLLTPIYESSTEIIVNQSETREQNVLNLQDVQTNLQLVDTYSVIIKSPRIIDQVIETLDLPLSTQELIDKVEVTAVENSQVISIKVEDPSLEQAVAIANTTAEVFQAEVVEIMNVDNVQILNAAEVTADAAPVKPRTLLNVAIAFVVGLMTAVGIAFLLEYLDNTFKTEKEIEQILELPVLGTIPRMDDDISVKRPERSRVRSNAKSVKGEAYEQKSATP